MIQGAVSADLEALIPLDLLAVDGSVVPVSALLDTGFNGDLVLPQSLIDRDYAGERQAELGDGLLTNLTAYSGRVRWIQADLDVSVLSGNGPLVGMNLLRGRHVTIDVETGGAVQIM